LFLFSLLFLSFPSFFFPRSKFLDPTPPFFPARGFFRAGEPAKFRTPRVSDSVFLVHPLSPLFRVLSPFVDLNTVTFLDSSVSCRCLGELRFLLYWGFIFSLTPALAPPSSIFFPPLRTSRRYELRRYFFWLAHADRNCWTLTSPGPPLFFFSSIGVPFSWMVSLWLSQSFIGVFPFFADG